MKLVEKILRGIGIAILTMVVGFFIFMVVCRIWGTFKIDPDRIDFVLAFWSITGLIALWAFNGILALGKFLKEKTRMLISSFSLFFTGLAVFLGTILMSSTTFESVGGKVHVIISWENFLGYFRGAPVAYIMGSLLMILGSAFVILGCLGFVEALKKKS